MIPQPKGSSWPRSPCLLHCLLMLLPPHPATAWVQTLLSSGLPLTAPPRPPLPPFNPAPARVPGRHGTARTLAFQGSRSLCCPDTSRCLALESAHAHGQALRPHRLSPATFPSPLYLCASSSRNPIHDALFSSISISPPPGSLLAPPLSPVAPIMCLQSHLS